MVINHIKRTSNTVNVNELEKPTRVNLKNSVNLLKVGNKEISKNKTKREKRRG